MSIISVSGSGYMGSRRISGSASASASSSVFSLSKSASVSALFCWMRRQLDSMYASSWMDLGWRSPPPSPPLGGPRTSSMAKPATGDSSSSGSARSSSGSAPSMGSDAPPPLSPLPPPAPATPEAGRLRFGQRVSPGSLLASGSGAPALAYGKWSSSDGLWQRRTARKEGNEDGEKWMGLGWRRGER